MSRTPGGCSKSLCTNKFVRIGRSLCLVPQHRPIQRYYIVLQRWNCSGFGTPPPESIAIRAQFQGEDAVAVPVSLKNGSGGSGSPCVSKTGKTELSTTTMALQFLAGLAKAMVDMIFLYFPGFGYLP